MCPSADRDYSTTENKITFIMSNVVPQAPWNNQRCWANLETYCRTLADAGNEMYIISGPGGQGGDGSAGAKTVLANGVVVPNYTWKVVLILPNGSSDASRVTSSTRVIAVKIPNSQSVANNSWGMYRTSVDAIESLTGYNLYSALPSAVQSVIEARVDNGPTN
jgi:endonuclease G